MYAHESDFKTVERQKLKVLTPAHSAASSARKQLNSGEILKLTEIRQKWSNFVKRCAGVKASWKSVFMSSMVVSYPNTTLESLSTPMVTGGQG